LARNDGTMNPKRYWADMSWQDFQSGNPGEWIAVVPVAAIEQHGPHLPLNVDVEIADGYLARVHKLLPQNLPATFLAVQAIGKSDEHRDFPGTLTFSWETLIRAWIELGESVYRAGLRKIVFVNSHGGNSSVLDIVTRELRAKFGMFAALTSWHRLGYPEGLFDATERLHGIHGGEIETSLMLAFAPDKVRMDKLEDFVPVTRAMEKDFKILRAAVPAGFGWMTQDLQATGAIGNAKAGTKEKGEEAADFGAKAFVSLLEDVQRFDLKRLKKGPLT
jgi:creatinine amidohydrolase